MQIANHDIGPELADQRQRILAVRGFADDVDIDFACKDHAESGAHQRMVVDQEYPDHVFSPDFDIE